MVPEATARSRALKDIGADPPMQLADVPEATARSRALKVFVLQVDHRVGRVPEATARSRALKVHARALQPIAHGEFLKPRLVREH